MQPPRQESKNWQEPQAPPDCGRRSSANSPESRQTAWNPPGWRTLPGLNLCGAGRVVCLIDPVGDVYACPFAIHENFLAGSVRQPGGFQAVWRDSELFAELRQPQSGGACRSCQFYDSCRGGCMAAKFFTGLPLDGPDPECARGFGDTALQTVDRAAAPRPALDHSHRRPVRGQAGPVPVVIAPRPPDPGPPARVCDESPLAGFAGRSEQAVSSRCG